MRAAKFTTMVSYPDTGPADRQTLAIRPVSRAPSVASTSRAPLISSHRRHSRQIRSHAGGASYQPQNEFPVFTHTGDVEIIITSNPHSRRGSVNAVTPYGGATAPRREERFLLHRLILAQCSGFFDEETTPDGGGGQQLDRTIPSGSALARLPPGAPALDETGRRKRWRFELDWGENGDEMPVLVQKVRLRIIPQLQSLATNRFPRKHRLSRSPANMHPYRPPSTTNLKLPAPASSEAWRNFPR